MIWVKNHLFYKGNNKYLTDRDVFCTKYLQRIIFPLYSFNYFYLLLLTMLYCTSLYIYWTSLWVITYISLYICGFSLTRFKEFKELWPWYFYSPLVKDIDTFWRVRGLIEGFNKFHRNINLGLEKTADKLMSVIWFLTTSKGYLAH